MPWVGGEGVKVCQQAVAVAELQSGLADQRPGAHRRPRATAPSRSIPAFGLPAINTLILLTSGVTVTIAHHALRAGHRGVLKFWLALTFLLGFTFVGLQAHEYGEAYHEMGLRLRPASTARRSSC